MPILMKHLDNMFKKTYIEEETVCLTYAPVDIFLVISRIFEIHQHCDEDELCSALLGLIFKMLSALQGEMTLILSEGAEP